jgi:hypothetical protein
MKIFLRISVVALLMASSCEKEMERAYTLKFYGDAYEDIGYSVAIANDGYIIAGQVEELTRANGMITGRNKNMGVFKTGWDGNVKWKVSAGGKFSDWGSKIYQNSDGSLLCIGTFTDTTTSVPEQTDLFAVKISATGDIIWQKTYGGSGNQTGKDVVKTSKGYMILGSTDLERPPATDSLGNVGGKKDILFLKINDNGDIVNYCPYGFGGNDIGEVIKPDVDSNFIVFGTTERSPDKQKQAGTNSILIKINSDGNPTDPRIMGGLKDEYAGDMEVLPDGYLLAYTVGNAGENRQIEVIKMKNDIFSTPYFIKQYTITDPGSSGPLSSFANAMAKYNNSFVIAGYSVIGSSARMLVFEIDPEGNQVEGHQVIKGSTGNQIAYDVDSGNDGYIIAVGKESYDINSMMTLLKFRF